MIGSLPADTALSAAKDRIARALLPCEPSVRASLGSVTLRDHQTSGATQLLRMLHQDGGALLADPVGVGKTYTALAIAQQYRSPLVIAPAGLRGVWCRALDATATHATVISMEALSRRDVPATNVHDLVIIDEAHHVRSTDTHRYEAVAALCRHAHVLLLSATPVHNQRRDLESQLALFLGSRASALGDAELAKYVVRRLPQCAGLVLPDVDGPHALTVAEDDDCLRAIMAIPPPLPAQDEGVAAVLLTYSLVHQWASSRAALVASLRRRRARAIAMREAIMGGRQPTKRELSAWCFDGSAIQLAFPTLVVRSELTAVHAEQSLDQLDRYCLAISDVLGGLRLPNPDHARARALDALCARHPGARVVAFSQYAETVRAYTAELWRSRGVAQLTARGARIASGPISRREIIEQFGPGRTEEDPTPLARRVDLLVTTDLLSEGVDLHGAAVVVHLDLPWNPARLEQRLGRLRRLGSPHERVHAYAMMPPAAAEHMLEIERRLRDKLSVAESTVGTTMTTPFTTVRSPSLEGVATLTPSPTDLMQSTRTAIRLWLAGGDASASTAGPVVAAVRTATSVAGFLALVECDGESRLVASLGGPVSIDPAIVHAAVGCAGGAGAPVRRLALDAALDNLSTWMSQRRIAASVGSGNVSLSGIRRATLERVRRCIDRAPRHRRAAVVSLASVARGMLAGRLSAGDERSLTALSRVAMDDEAWLRVLGRFHGDDISAADVDGAPLPLNPPAVAHQTELEGVHVVILIEAGCAR